MSQVEVQTKKNSSRFARTIVFFTPGYSQNGGAARGCDDS